MITTILGFSSPDMVPVYAKYNHGTFFVAISDAGAGGSLTRTFSSSAKDQQNRSTKGDVK
jgi:hypothetical protein